MIEKLKAIRLHFTLTSVLEIALGIILLIWSLLVVGILAKVIGIVVVVCGLVEVVAKIFDDRARIAGIFAGLILSIIGGWIFIHPEGIIKIIPIFIGAGLVVHGIQNFALANEGRKVNAPKWGLLIVGAVISIILGGVCIFCAIRVVDLAVKIGGVFMIYDGLASILMIHHVNRAERDVDSVIISERDVEDF